MIFKKKQDILSAENSRNCLANPSYLFSQCGPTLNKYWRALIDGENIAVAQYQRFCDFLSKENKKELADSFEEVMLSVDNEKGDKELDLTRGQVAYLSTFDFRDDIFLSDQDESDVYQLSLEQLLEAVNDLTEDEINYRNKIVSYFSYNIVPIVNDIANLQWDINICKHELPLNTATCVKYHRYIAEEKYDFEEGELSKWNYVFSAPIYEYWTGRDNPIVPAKINSMNFLVLDCLCYANISLPSQSILKLLNYNNGKDDIKDILEKKFGPGVMSFINRCIADFNCASFRKWVSLGLKIK